MSRVALKSVYVKKSFTNEFNDCIIYQDYKYPGDIADTGIIKIFTLNAVTVLHEAFICRIGKWRYH